MDKDLENLAGRQREALADGHAAERAWQPVIYIHGRPYADAAGKFVTSNEGARPAAQLAARDRGAVEAAYGRILAEAAEDHRHSVAPRKSELDMDL